MTRIAILSPYARPVPGGISSFVAGLQGLLVSRGHKVAVLAGEGSGDCVEHSNLGHGRRFARRSLALLRRLQPEVVHCHAHWYVLAPGVRYCRRAVGTRLVFSFHTTSVPRWRGRLRHLLLSTDVATFVSAAQLAELRQVLRLGGDLRLLSPAIDLRRIDTERARAWALARGLERGFPTLVFAGPLEYEAKVRGVLDLISGFGTVRRQLPNARLLIVGDGALRPRVEAAAAPLGNSVLITGMMDEPALALANADVYCHVSYQEGLPFALLEAMSMGCPVIGSKTGGIPEVLDGENGILVEPGAKPVADAILRLVNDPAARKAIGLAGAETVRSFFQWQSRLPQLLAAYGIGG